MRGYLQPVVLGVTASGVALAYHVAIALGAPLNMASDTASERPSVDVSGRSVILVTDAIVAADGTGAALRILRPRAPRRIIVAAPVAVPEGVDELRRQVDEVVYLLAAARIARVEDFYEEFGAVSNEEVLALLARSRS